MNTKPFQMLFNVLAILALSLAPLPPAARAAIPIDDPGLAGRAPLAPLAPLATQILGGAPVEGNLRVEVYDEGSIGIFRYDSANAGGTWETLVYNGQDSTTAENPNKNSRLQYGSGGGGYYFGWPDAVGSNSSDTQAAAVSNTRISDTVVSVFIAGSTRVTQTVSYSNGNDFIRYDWDIQNTGGGTLNDLRFFHGMDTCLGLLGYYCDYPSDRGGGLWFPAARAVGVRRVASGVETRFYLQGVTPPTNYDSLEYSWFWSHMDSGALLNQLDTDPDTDNGYGLEWRKDSLAQGAVWHITAYERFKVGPFDSVFVVAPPFTEIPQGATQDLIYTLTNDDTVGVSVDLSVSTDQPTWTATLQGATNRTVPAHSSITVTVSVGVPGSASIGDTGLITLTADGPAAGVSSDNARVIVTEGTVTQFYTLTIARAGTGDGVVTPTVGMHSYLSGAVVTLGATAYPTSTFEGWSGDADCADGSVTMTANKACTATFTLSAQPSSLALTKTASPTSAKPGEAITYTIAFSNTGEITATNVLITDTLSPNITNPNWSSSGVPLTLISGQTYAWSAPDLAPGEGGIITITGVLTKPLAAGVFTNTVTLAVSGTVKTATSPLTVQNVAPVADAGADQMVVVNGHATLNGSGTDDNGDTLTYGWVQTGGPAVTLSSPTAQHPTFTAPSVATVLTFTLTVTDTGGLSATDTVVVNVRHVYYFPIIFRSATHP